MRQVKRKRTCEYPGRSCGRIGEKMRSNNEPQEVSRGHSTGKKLGMTEQSLVPSKLQKEVSMMNGNTAKRRAAHKEIVRNTKGMRERRVLAVRKERNRAVRICLKGS